MKAYLIEKNDGSFKIEKRTHISISEKCYENIPVDPLTGKFEDPRWLQIENINDEFGIQKQIITVNEVLKAQLQNDDFRNEQKHINELTQDKSIEDSLYNYLLSFDENNLNNINDIRVFASNIKKYFLLKYKQIINQRKNKG